MYKAIGLYVAKYQEPGLPAVIDESTIEYLRNINWPFLAPYIVVNFGIPATYAALAARYAEGRDIRTKFRAVAWTLAIGLLGGVLGYGLSIRYLGWKGPETNLLAPLPAWVYLGPIGLFFGSLLGSAVGMLSTHSRRHNAQA